MKDETPAKLGRHKTIDGPGSSVSTWVSASLHDRLVRLAGQRADQSVSATVRELLQTATAFPTKN